MIRTAVVGASGFTGAELLRLAAGHPEIEVVAVGAHSHAGELVGGLYPSLAGSYPSLCFEDLGPEDLVGYDLVFLALPHGASEAFASKLVGKVGALVDLSADFRLRDAGAYEAWYGRKHGCPELIASFAYGLPELFRDEIASKRMVAAPGCYPTAAALALAPFTRASVVETEGVVVDAASGVSGAGAGLSRQTHFSAVDEDFKAYGLLQHRHTPEIEQAAGAKVLFTPHLAPMSRGILATCYARAKDGLDRASAMALLERSYGEEPFVLVADQSPSTKATLGSNSAHLSVWVDERTGWLVSVCAIDNLVKGASGQAIQCANIILGLAETLGLAVAGLYP
jgi:N-acetyl-gamma-glutamyl-phosphate reductase